MSEQSAQLISNNFLCNPCNCPIVLTQLHTYKHLKFLIKNCFLRSAVNLFVRSYFVINTHCACVVICTRNSLWAPSRGHFEDVSVFFLNCSMNLKTQCSVLLIYLRHFRNFFLRHFRYHTVEKQVNFFKLDLWTDNVNQGYCVRWKMLGNCIRVFILRLFSKNIT